MNIESLNERTKEFSPRSSHSTLCLLQSGLLFFTLLGSQLSHSQTADETLFAIREIYGNQASCTMSQGVTNTYSYASGFVFSHSYSKDAAELLFLYLSGTRGDFRSGPDEFYISFDLRKIASIRPVDEEGNFPKLMFECANREGCVYFSGWDEKYSRWSTVFCSKDARSRVVNALMHLKKITPPLPALKF